MSVEMCSLSMACDMEEVCSESSRKMQDKEETTSEASWTAATKGTEKVMWRLEPEGERENQAKMEEKVDGKAPGEEGAEIQSPKRKVIRVESEETPDYVRYTLNLSRDKAEEKSFVPSAISIPQRPMFWCDSRCSDKALRFWQFASVVVEDGKESYTANLCQLWLQRKRDGKGSGAF